MNKKEIEALVDLRQGLIAKFARLKDYKSNKNAIMREQDHAKLLHETIVNIDNILKEHVAFDNKK